LGETRSRQLNRADTVDEQSHLHAGARAVDHALHRLSAERVVAENIGADIQAIDRAGHGGEQGGRGFAAVLVQANRRGCARRQPETLDEVFGPVRAMRTNPDHRSTLRGNLRRPNRRYVGNAR